MPNINDRARWLEVGLSIVAAAITSAVTITATLSSQLAELRSTDTGVLKTLDRHEQLIANQSTYSALSAREMGGINSSLVAINDRLKSIDNQILAIRVGPLRGGK